MRARISRAGTSRARTVGRRAVGALAASVLVLAGGWAAEPVAAASPPGGVANRTPIEHVVTVMQEGHTFDNYFGSYSEADGLPADVCMPVDPAVARPCVRPFSLGDRPLRDLKHGPTAFQTAYNGGAMNGFVGAQSRDGVTEAQAMGSYRRSDLPFYWDVADEYVLFDRFFSSSSGSLANHLSWVSGTTGPATGETVPTEGFGDIPTIFDRLEAKGISWKFYVQNYDPTVTFRRAPGSARGAQVVRVPLLAYARYVDDPELFSHIVPVSQYYEDLQNGELPAVSYIVPSGPSERSPTNVSSGERFVQSLVGALASSSAWSTSAFVLTYDGWGGYYDHVPPQRVDGVATGFRVPSLLVSAYARKGFVDHSRLETTSILRFVEDNWQLDPLASRDAQAPSLVSALDFTRAPRPARLLTPGAPAAFPALTGTGVVFVLYGLAAIAALAVLVTAALRARRRTEVVLP